MSIHPRLCPAPLSFPRWSLALLLVLLLGAPSLPGQVYEEVFSITETRVAEYENLGETPVGALLLGADGSYYGATMEGGTNNLGTLYKVTSGGTLTTLIHFSGLTGDFKGSLPLGGLTLGHDGNFYGTTSKGGAGNFGTLFRLTPAGVFTTLVEFTGTVGSFKGNEPGGALLLASDGHFYGATQRGGAGNIGTVFRLTHTGGFTLLSEAAGHSPLLEGADGLLYGVDGTWIYRIARDGTGFTVAAEFNAANGFPDLLTASPMALGSDGNYYGTRGNDIYRFTTAGQLSVLVSQDIFDNTRKINSALYLGRDGFLYGTGTSRVVRLAYDGQRTAVGSFSVAEVGSPDSSAGTLIEGQDGNFYGTALQSNFYGLVFKMTPAGVATLLLEFSGTGESDLPRQPYAGLTLASDGNFYGTLTTGGGAASSGVTGGGVIRVTPAGEVTILAELQRCFSSVTEGSDGNLFGTIVEDFTNQDFYKLSPTGTILARGTLPGDNVPFAPLILATDGMLYGTSRTILGGSSPATVYRMTHDLTVQTLATLGGSSQAALLEASDGNFYGTTTTTIFCMTPAGVLTTITTFSDTVGPNKGRLPYGRLVEGGDGQLYGTTFEGGTPDFGTVFRVTKAGVLTTLAEFSGTTGSTKGSEPYAGLVLHTDGSFYGTTNRGGTNDRGTVFRLTPGGVFSTVFEFASLPVDYNPHGTLVGDGEGNLYGTARRPDGGIYRLIFPGSPSLFLQAPLSVGKTSAVLQLKANARGSSSTIVAEVGTDGLDFPITVPMRVGLTGYQTTQLGATLAGLTPGTTYHYRFRGSNGHGTKVSAVSTFIAIAEPTVEATPATVITQTSARLNGVVNARTSATTVIFEWGTSSNSFPNQVTATPGTVTGTTDTAVLASIAGLTKGQMIFFRLVATNAGGAVVSGVQTFSTLTDPGVILGAASAVGTTTASVAGRVNRRGADTTAVFEYGTDGVNFPNSVAATPSPITEVGLVDVSATLGGLAQGTTYHFRLKATSAGGTGTTGSTSFTTLALPAVSGAEATAVGSATATLNAMVNANGLTTAVVFEYGPSAGVLPFSVTATPGTVTAQGMAVSAGISGLLPETGYFFRVRATSAAGEVTTSPLNFIMSPSARAVTGAGSASLAATAVVATLNGTVNGFGQQTIVSFDYGTNSNALNQSRGATPGSVSGNNDTTVAAEVPGLAQGMTYFFRVKASNGGGTTTGAVQQFTTPTKGGLVAREDFIFYAGAILIDPLRNDEDPDAQPPGDKSRLLLDPDLVQVPTVSQNVATVSDTQKTIAYQPQFNVKEVDTLIYRVGDGFGGTADATVNLITFGSRAGFYSGLVEDVANAPGRVGTLALLLSSGGSISTAFANWQGESFRLKGAFDQFGELTAIFTSSNDPRVTLTLALAMGRTSKTVTGQLIERTDGTETARVDSFTLILNAGSGGLPEAGLRTAFLSPPAALAEQMGDGYLLMTVAKNRRSARLAGQLPDGEPFTLGAPAQGRAFSVTKPLEQGGLLSGLVRVVGSDDDEAGMLSSLLWQKRASARARYHRTGVVTFLELLGLEYPVLTRNDLPPIDLGTAMPNARVRLTGGDLKTPLDFPLNILSSGVSGFDPSQLKLKFQAPLGTFSGSFRHPATNKWVPFNGAFRVPLDTEPGQGRGNFHVPGASGAVRIEAP